MAQVKIYGERTFLRSSREALSDLVHASARSAFGLPEDKRFHRFIGLDAEDLIAPPGRSAHYVIVEVLMFEGRSVAAKKAFYAALYDGWSSGLGHAVDDLEIVIIETPRANWGIRGLPGDELALTYAVDV